MNGYDREHYYEPTPPKQRNTARRLVFGALLALVVLGIIAILAGCGEMPASSADEAAAKQTRAMMNEAASQVGLPAIQQFSELRNAKMVSELRDQAIKTWTYTVDVNGGRHLLCESVGYGLPYSVQITNPERVLMGHEYPGTGTGGTIPQPEPNGLFMPEAADATWVMCSDGKGGIAPVYSEPHLLVAPFPLGHIDAAQNSGRNDQVQIERVPVSQAP